MPGDPSAANSRADISGNGEDDDGGEDERLAAAAVLLVAAADVEEEEVEGEEDRRREGVGQADDEEGLDERSGGMAVTGGAPEADTATLMT